MALVVVVVVVLIKKIKTSQFIEIYRDCDKEKANMKTFNIIELFTNSIYEIISMLNLFL